MSLRLRLSRRLVNHLLPLCHSGKRAISNHSLSPHHTLPLLTSGSTSTILKSKTDFIIMPAGNFNGNCKSSFTTSALLSGQYQEPAQSSYISHDDNLVVCVEGNIGCGKTTLLNYFQNGGDCEVIAEPVEKWRNIDGHNALELMYKDPSRWSMALQTYVQLTMVQNHTKPMTHPVRLMERSIYSAKYCFVDNLYTSGKLPELEYIILTEWFNWILQSQNFKVDLIVYLRTDPELLHQRIMSRCREEEKCIPLEYLKCLHDLHEDWLIHKKHPCPDVLVLDANKTLDEMERVYELNKNNICKKPTGKLKTSTLT